MCHSGQQMQLSGTRKRNVGTARQHATMLPIGSKIPNIFAAFKLPANRGEAVHVHACGTRRQWEWH